MVVVVDDVGCSIACIADVITVTQNIFVKNKVFFDIAKIVFARILVEVKQSKHIFAVFDVYFDCLIKSAE